MLADTNQIEHFEQISVSRFRDTAPQHLFLARDDCPRIGKNNPVRISFDDNAPALEIVRIHKTVCNGFPNSPMFWRFFYAIS